jgi:hypothetical protein
MLKNFDEIFLKKLLTAAVGYANIPLVAEIRKAKG